MEHWFWKYAFENKNVYIQAGIATLLVNLFALVLVFLSWLSMTELFRVML